MKACKYKISICGHFGGTKNFLDGQTIKTKNIYEELANIYNKDKILCLDTYKWKKRPISFIIKCIYANIKSKNIIMLPAQNGIKILVPLFNFMNKFFKRKIFYIVIGGWLPELLNKRKKLIKKIKRLDNVFVETNTIKEQLERKEINNVVILKNFKQIKVIEKSQLYTNFYEPYRLCILSRILKNKGIEEAIKAIKQINNEYNRKIFILDIYGPIENNYKEKFFCFIEKNHDYINYKGIVDSNKTVEILRNYYLLLFPTKFYTEGIPGTIIDAFSAGVPVLASKWQSFNDIIYEDYNGLGYEFNNYEDLILKLKKCMDNKFVTSLKVNCLKSARLYNPQEVIKKITELLD